MKWRYVDKMERFIRIQYYFAKKKGCIIQISNKKWKSKWIFTVQRNEDDFTFNSAWDCHPNPLYQTFMQELQDTSKFTLEEMQEYVEKWVDKNVPSLKK